MSGDSLSQSDVPEEKPSDTQKSKEDEEESSGSDTDPEEPELMKEATAVSGRDTDSAQAPSEKAATDGASVNTPANPQLVVAQHAKSVTTEKSDPRETKSKPIQVEAHKLTLTERDIRQLQLEELKKLELAPMLLANRERSSLYPVSLYDLLCQKPKPARRGRPPGSKDVRPRRKKSSEPPPVKQSKRGRPKGSKDTKPRRKKGWSMFAEVSSESDPFLRAAELREQVLSQGWPFATDLLDKRIAAAAAGEA